MNLGIGCSVRNFATRYVVTGYGLVSARLSGLCEYSNRTSGYVFVFPGNPFNPCNPWPCYDAPRCEPTFGLKSSALCAES